MTVRSTWNQATTAMTSGSRLVRVADVPEPAWAVLRERGMGTRRLILKTSDM